MNATAYPTLTRTTGPSIASAILLIVFGFLAILVPAFPSLGIVFMIGCLVLFAGLVQLFHAFQSKGIGHILWKLLIAACYLIAGVYLMGHPILGLAGLTLTLAWFFVALGVIDIIAYFSSRKAGGSGWILADGIVTLALGAFVWSRWPAVSLWFVGTLIGISMVMTGVTRLMMALTVRKLVQDYGERPSEHRWAA
jgi:uncharacterized membrane protein HdeD (DUF308 family)